MEKVVPILFLALFAASTFVLYLLVRRQQTTSNAIIISGAVANILFLILFALTRGTEAGRAVLIGTVLGTLFAIVPVVTARFFQSNASHAGRS